jgi:hypothetical protein
VLIPLTVLGFAIKSLGDEDRSRKCALGLIVFSSGWSLATLGYSLNKLTGSAGLMILLGGLGSIAMLGSIVLAILGLIDVSGDGPRKKTGTGQAIATLILGGVFLLSGVIGFLTAGDGLPADWKMTQPVRGSRVSVVPKNFSIAEPGPGWIQIVATKLNPRADVAFVNPKKTIYLIVLAHDIPAANLTPLRFWADAARGEMKQIDPGAVVSEGQPLTLGTCQGVAFDAQATREGKHFVYREWVGIHGSKAYQVLAWGLQPNAALVRSEADRIIATFETLTK